MTLQIGGNDIGSRDACKGALVRWVEPWIPANPAAPLHPNRRGMTGASGLLSAALR